MQSHIPEELKSQLYLCEKIHNPHTLYNLYTFEIYDKIQSSVFVLSVNELHPLSCINWTDISVARYYSVYDTVQVMVKVILERTTKAQRGNKVIALLFP